LTDAETVRLLLSPDPDDARRALAELAARPAPGRGEGAETLAALLAVMLFTPDKALRAVARDVAFAWGGQPVRERFDGDARAYHKITDRKKLAKLAKDLGRELDVDAALFSRFVVKMFVDHQHQAYHEEALAAALRFEGNAPEVFQYLETQTEVYLVDVKKKLPPGLGRLKALEWIRIIGDGKGDVDVSAIAELAALPSLRRLEYWIPVRDLHELDAVRHLRELEFRGPDSRLADISALAGWTDLEHLNLAATGVTDLSPLRGLTRMRYLNVSETRVADLEPLRAMTSLRTLNLSKTRVGDLSVLAALPELEQVTLDFLDVGDLGFLAGASKLTKLGLWGAKVSSLENLAGLPLEQLELLYTRLPDLSPLAKVSTLQWINLVGTAPPPETLEALQRALPALHVNR